MSVDSIDETSKAVLRFLEDYRSLIKDRKPYFSPREKNWKVLTDLGLTLTDQWKLIQELTVEDYISGPEPDRIRRGDVWVFGVNLQTVELYIKLQISEYTPLDTNKLIRQPICISFHAAEYPLCYPLK